MFNNATYEDESSGTGDEIEGFVSGDSFISPSLTPHEQMGVPSTADCVDEFEYIAVPAYHNPASAIRTRNNEETSSCAVIMRPAYKRYLIVTPLPVLVIHLKRFKQITQTHSISFSHGFRKLDD